MSDPPGIADLDAMVAALEPRDRAIFERIFRVDVAVGEQAPPESMLGWIEQQFGAVEPVLRQEIVKVTNRVTFEGALFNRLRSSRPQQRRPRTIDIAAGLRDAEDPLANPEAMTPADPFGRIRGEHCITASNVAKFDGLHGLVVFDEPDPLRFDRACVRDYLSTAREWIERAHDYSPGARFPLVVWNCLWRAGASLAHGHLQVLLGAGAHYAGAERLLDAERRYDGRYFDDVFHAHCVVGSGFAIGEVRVMASLTPVKEREVVMMTREWRSDLHDRIYEALAYFRDEAGVESFNLALIAPPLGAVEGWEAFPHVVRIVDRGDLTARTADVAAMELFAASVVSSDPIALARGLRDAMGAAS